jgi:hypothetical protein
MPDDNGLPKEVTDQWPGILDEIDIKVIPEKYIQSVEVMFLDGNTWNIDVPSDLSDNDDLTYLEEVIEELFEEYEDSIQGINFVLDVAKVKHDITKRTKSFMKKKK